MKKIVLACLLLVATLSFSCNEKQPATQTFLKDKSLHAGFEKAKAENKGLLLISNKTGCSMCELFEVDLMKDETYANQIYSDFVIQRVNENATGNKWLSRILNRGSFPIFLFFNKERKLIGLQMGAIKKDRMGKLLNKVRNSESWVDGHFQMGTEKDMSQEKILDYVGNVIEAQYQWDSYNLSKQKTALAKMEAPLKESINAYSTFYNNYLLSKYYALNNNSDQATKNAETALLVEDPAALYFNSGLRTELKMIADKNYNAYTDAYIGLPEVDKNLGKLKFAAKTMVEFPVKNIGKKDLFLNNIVADCNCTVANYPKTAIRPGDTGIIRVNFTASRSGEFAHMLEIGSNASNAPLQLTIKGLVLGD